MVFCVVSEILIQLIHKEDPGKWKKNFGMGKKNEIKLFW